MKIFYFISFLLFITTYSYSQNPCPGTPTVDYAGKTYHTVQIGTQCWLQENLDVGTRINVGLDQTNNEIIEKYCYNDDSANCTTYGGYYQWAEAVQYTNGATNFSPPNPVFTGNVQGICPSGWHLPTVAEFQTLDTTVGGNSNALKAVGQGIPQYGGAGTNTSGFSALLTGYRDFGIFLDFGAYAEFWSTVERFDFTWARSMNIFGNTSIIDHYINCKSWGINVRCVKDESTGINDHSNNTLPKSIELLQNFPNPFNPSTSISFTLPERTNVILSVYNELGEKVAVLFNGEKEAGTHSLEWNASKFVSGVYIYELKTDKYSLTKKLLLMK